MCAARLGVTEISMDFGWSSGGERLTKRARQRGRLDVLTETRPQRM